MPLPRIFRSDMDFLEFCKCHSQTPRASFCTAHVDYLYELAGKISPFESTSHIVNIPLHYDEPITRKLLDKAKKNVLVKAREGNNVVHLDDYR